MIVKLCVLNSVRRKADRSLIMSFETLTEQSSHELHQLDEMFQQDCVIAIKPEETPFLDAEIKDLDSIDMDLEDNTKTPSKRLRNVLYRLYEKEDNGEFKDFYKSQMERIINHFKGKLD